MKLHSHVAIGYPQMDPDIDDMTYPALAAVVYGVSASYYNKFESHRGQMEDEKTMVPLGDSGRPPI